MPTDLSTHAPFPAKSSAIASQAFLGQWAEEPFACDAATALTPETRAHQKSIIVDVLIALSDHDPALAMGLAHMIALRCPWFKGA